MFTETEFKEGHSMNNLHMTQILRERKLFRNKI